jgi:hypothetical protein
LIYILNWIQHVSLLTRLRSYSYRTVISSLNRIRELEITVKARIGVNKTLSEATTIKISPTTLTHFTELDRRQSTLTRVGWTKNRLTMLFARPGRVRKKNGSQPWVEKAGSKNKNGSGTTSARRADKKRSE